MRIFRLTRNSFSAGVIFILAMNEAKNIRSRVRLGVARRGFGRETIHCITMAIQWQWAKGRYLRAMRARKGMEGRRTKQHIRSIVGFLSLPLCAHVGILFEQAMPLLLLKFETHRNEGRHT